YQKNRQLFQAADSTFFGYFLSRTRVTNPKKAVCHNWPSVSLLSEFGLSHMLMYVPIVLILSA
ncbi:MAG: hypothetical protein K2G64_03840, partial [Muribaculaceae bacterium]|nr:hypothetical protein [Muribaculaceae bacterium]